MTTAALVVIQHVMQKKWAWPSRLVAEIGIYQRDLVPLAHRSLLTIPIVLLLIHLHVRSFSVPRLDTTTPSALRMYHRQQATLVRGVLVDALEGA
jgi:hypothetical protein